MKEQIEEVKNILTKYEQQHIIRWIEKLEEQDKKKLINQISTWDFEEIKKLYETTKTNIDIKKNKIEKIGYIDINKLDKETFNKYKNIGKDIIKNNEYAVITLAGGQGTRLGHSGPKGTFKIQTDIGEKYLFEIIVDGLNKAKEKYGVFIQWYIMTSEENDEQTKEFLSNNNFFGYPKEKIMFFKQGKAPLLDMKGKLLIDENKMIKEASDGNGSVYNSLKKHGVLQDMKNKGIEWVFVGGVDNVLLKIVDPILTGITKQEKNLISSKSVVKINPKERVGVFCKINGKPSVIEYTELPEEMAEKLDSDKELVFGEVNILSHLYNIKALEELGNIKLPYHRANKKVSYLNENGELVKPTETNVYKYESFIFDGFAFYNNMSILRVNRKEEFAPIKNAEGADSPETATKLYNNKLNNI